MAGRHYNLAGDGSNFVCLPENPQYGPSSWISGATSQIYGVQYEFIDSILSNENNDNQTMNSGDAVCAACGAANGRSTSVMIPARVECPIGWTK